MHDFGILLAILLKCQVALFCPAFFKFMLLTFCTFLAILSQVFHCIAVSCSGFHFLTAQQYIINKTKTKAKNKTCIQLM